MGVINGNARLCGALVGGLLATAALPLVAQDAGRVLTADDYARAEAFMGYVLAYGMAQGVGQFGLLFLGLKLGMTASMASVVIQAQAFFTLMMAAAWLGEHTRRWQWLGLAVAFGGLWVIASAHTEGAKQMTLVGFVLTLGSAFMWAVSNLVARAAARAGNYAPFPFII